MLAVAAQVRLGSTGSGQVEANGDWSRNPKPSKSQSWGMGSRLGEDPSPDSGRLPLAPGRSRNGGGPTSECWLLARLFCPLQSSGLRPRPLYKPA